MTMILDPNELARTLKRDLGIESAIKYAEAMGRSGTELGRAYAEAHRIILDEHDLFIRRRCAECDAYPATSGDLCEGCAAYQEHTTVY